MIHISDLLDEAELQHYIDEKLINVRDHNDLPLNIYNYSKEATVNYQWPDTIRVCRGLITDFNGIVVARPFKKFFNLEEADSTIARLDEAECLEITRKMDGMFGIHYGYNEQYGVSTRGSFNSDGAIFATNKFQKFVKYGSIHEIPQNITLIFEIIAKHLRIVKAYDWEGLVLTGAIDIETGREYRKDELTDVWGMLNQYSKNKPWCRLVEFFDDKSVQECQEDDDKEEEGYVITGHFKESIIPVKAKIKLAEYKRRHKLLTTLSPNQIHEKFARPLKEYLPVITSKESIPKEYVSWVKGLGQDYTSNFFAIYDKVKEAHNYYLDAINATSIVFSNKNDVKNHALRTTKSRYGSLADLALLIENKEFFQLYSEIWRLFRPVGEGNPFYQEGSKE